MQRHSMITLIILSKEICLYLKHRIIANELSIRKIRPSVELD